MTVKYIGKKKMFEEIKKCVPGLVVIHNKCNYNKSNDSEMLFGVSENGCSFRLSLQHDKRMACIVVRDEHDRLVKHEVMNFLCA